VVNDLKLSSRYYTAEAITTEGRKASRGLSATAELLVYAEGGPISIKFRRLVHNDNVHCGDMVVIETRSRIPI